MAVEPTTSLYCKKVPRRQEGYLTAKKSLSCPRIQTRKYYCVLFSDVLQLFDNEKSYLHKKQSPRAQIDLQQVCSISETVQVTGYKANTEFCFKLEFYPEREMVFSAESKEKVKCWIECLKHTKEFYENFLMREKQMKEKQGISQNGKSCADIQENNLKDEENKPEIDPNHVKVSVTMSHGPKYTSYMKPDGDISDLWTAALKWLPGHFCEKCENCHLRRITMELWSVNNEGVATKLEDSSVDFYNNDLYLLEHNYKPLVVYFEDSTFLVCPADITIKAREIPDIDPFARKLSDIECSNAQLYLETTTKTVTPFSPEDQPLTRHFGGKLLLKSKALVMPWDCRTTAAVFHEKKIKKICEERRQKNAIKQIESNFVKQAFGKSAKAVFPTAEDTSTSTRVDSSYPDPHKPKNKTIKNLVIELPTVCSSGQKSAPFCPPDDFAEEVNSQHSNGEPIHCHNGRYANNDKARSMSEGHVHTPNRQSGVQVVERERDVGNIVTKKTRTVSDLRTLVRKGAIKQRHADKPRSLSCSVVEEVTDDDTKPEEGLGAIDKGQDFSLNNRDHGTVNGTSNYSENMIQKTSENTVSTSISSENLSLSRDSDKEACDASEFAGDSNENVVDVQPPLTPPPTRRIVIPQHSFDSKDEDCKSSLSSLSSSSSSYHSLENSKEHSHYPRDSKTVDSPNSSPAPSLSSSSFVEDSQKDHNRNTPDMDSKLSATVSCRSFGNSEKQPMASSFGNSEEPLSSFGNSVEQPSSVGNSVKQPSSFGNSVEQLSSVGNSVKQPSSFGNSVEQPSSVGNSEEPLSSFGNSVEQPSSVGNSVKQPSSFGNSVEQPSSIGNSEEQPMASSFGNSLEPLSSVGNSVKQPSSFGNSVEQPSSVGNSEEQPMASSFGNSLEPLSSVGNSVKQPSSFGNSVEQPSSVGNSEEQPSSVGNFKEQPSSVGNSEEQPSHSCDFYVVESPYILEPILNQYSKLSAGEVEVDGVLPPRKLCLSSVHVLNKSGCWVLQNDQDIHTDDSEMQNHHVISLSKNIKVAFDQSKRTWIVRRVPDQELVDVATSEKTKLVDSVTSEINDVIATSSSENMCDPLHQVYPELTMLENAIQKIFSQALLVEDLLAEGLDDAKYPDVRKVVCVDFCSALKSILCHGLKKRRTFFGAAKHTVWEVVEAATSNATSESAASIVKKITSLGFLEDRVRLDLFVCECLNKGAQTLVEWFEGFKKQREKLRSFYSDKALVMELEKDVLEQKLSRLTFLPFKLRYLEQVELEIKYRRQLTFIFE